MILEERKRAEEMARRISKERKNLIPDEIKIQILDFIEKDLVRTSCFGPMPETRDGSSLTQAPAEVTSKCLTV